MSPALREHAGSKSGANRPQLGIGRRIRERPESSASAVWKVRAEPRPESSGGPDLSIQFGGRFCDAPYLETMRSGDEGRLLASQNTHSLWTHSLSDPMPGGMSSPDKKRFGKKIRELRLAKGWTQEELAEQTGIHSTYIGGVERGERNLGLDNILKIARALGVRPSALFVDFLE